MSKLLTDYSNLIERLIFLAHSLPNETAFIFLNRKLNEESKLSFSNLDHSAKLIAAKLQAANLKTGDRAILLYPPGENFIKSLFGCFYAGVIAVPLYLPLNELQRNKLTNVLKNCDPAKILSDTSTFQFIQKYLPADFSFNKCLLTDDENSLPESNWRQAKIKTDQIAILQYTSGSTADPKGVMISHGNIMANEHLIYEAFDHAHSNLGVNWLPPYHDMGLIGAILQAIYAGKCSVLMSPLSFLENPIHWLQAISTYRADSSGGPNFAYAYCVKQITAEQCESLDLSCWKVAFNGAESINDNVMDEFSKKFAPYGFKPQAFLPCYGLAEATLLVSGHKCNKTPSVLLLDAQALQQHKVAPLLTENLSEYDHARPIVSCGFPLQTVKIVNPNTCEECEPSDIGEIWVAGPCVAAGYWKQAAQTKNLLQARLNHDDSTRYLRTGDLGFIFNKELYVTGRIKDLIIIQGANHYPHDIENTVLQAIPELSAGNVVAFSITAENTEQLIILLGKSKTYKYTDFAELCKSIAQNIFKAHHLTPSKIVLVKSSGILKTTSGKIRHQACREAFIDQTLPLIDMWESMENTKLLLLTRCPETPIEPDDINSITLLLKNCVANYLGIAPEAIHSHEPLAGYGLNSIAAVKISAQISESLQRELSPALIYQYPTIDELAVYLVHGEKITTASKDLPFFEPIAIIGMACTFPGDIETPEDFWKLLASGQNAISAIPTTRWDKTAEQSAVTYGGFLNNIDTFDAAFFGISPQEARLMDPQQRILLETSWKALEYAGIDPKSLVDSETGVYVGISQHDYEHILRSSQTADSLSSYALTGNVAAASSGRISYIMGLQGPSITLDTACSSSLVAIDMACSHLHDRQCDLAIVGGVNLILDLDTSTILSKTQVLATDGRCKVFDAKADGYVRSEGCGVVILKSLKDALANHDQILAVIQASSVNQDGHSQGFTAPNIKAQIKLMNNALCRARLSAHEIDYIEAHGTGTQLGDPIEVSAIDAVMKQTEKRKRPLLIGSVKTNIGHLESAAGMASLLKVILALQAKSIPANLHFNECNPMIDLQAIPALIPTTQVPWEKPEGVRRAAINSFGFTGTNAHLIIEEAPILSSNKKAQILPYSFNKQKFWIKNLLPDFSEFSSSLACLLKTQLEARIQQYNLASDNENELLTQFCLHYIQQALEKITLESVTEKQRRLAEHLLLVVKSHDNKTAPYDADQLCRQYPQAELEIRLAQRCGEQLDKVLQGKINALTLLFPENNQFSAEKLYLNSVYAKTINELLQTAIIHAEQD
jgi:phthiocerol/phenolphthiocerol synthesis type-I polyketide synthase C